MGAVFQAWDGLRRQPCAVKMLHPESPHGEMATVRFVDEAQLVARLCHPNIVEIWDYGRDGDGSDYLVMELLHGESLYSLMHNHGPLPLEVALDLIKQIGSALQAVHLSGIVHRDLKPQNILLIPSSAANDRWQAKVIDFGLAKLADHRLAPQRGSDGMLIGTASYLAPEAWRGVSAAVDARADQWALAVIAYRMLSGRLPYDAEDNTVALGMLIHHEVHTPLRELLPQVPQYVQDAIDRALQKDKELRFPSVLHFVQALHQLPSGGSVASVAPLQPAGCSQPVDEDDSLQPYVELTWELACVPMTPLPSSTPRSESSLHAASLYAGALQPLGPALTERLVSVASSSAPTLETLAVPGDRRRARSALLPYLLPSLSLLGALLAWSGVWLGTAAPVAGLPARLGRILPAIAGISSSGAQGLPSGGKADAAAGARTRARQPGLDESEVRPCPAPPPEVVTVNPDFEPPPAALDPSAAAPTSVSPIRTAYQPRLRLP